ncbi:DUF3263 domain-containing protein [Microbacterium dauci]|uniref:DUF3263 domain-containing protein n=1 Tax=Microbacterium dauci TaxID=3048008 RepID=A0ABT6ZAS1_9MICO|nr:DUF3263 domain-containing protein [Microbacterium sp. LX3-4]MDJ1113262.1 DUF3263 domain-containing protein [Microbacterium sp. LX3-4]
MPTDLELLTFEATHERHTGVKEETIRTELGMTPARYYQRLGRFIDTLDAVKHDPVLVHRLRRRQDQTEGRRRARLAS